MQASKSNVLNSSSETAVPPRGAPAMNRITVEQRGPVAVVRISGDALGLFGEQLLEPLDRAIRQLDADPEVQSVILTGGQPERFVSHADVRWLKSGGASVPELGRTAGSVLVVAAAAASRTRVGRLLARPTPLHGAVQLYRLHALLSFMQASGVVYIAAINGTALGLGAELAWACDLRVMKDGEAVIGHPEVLLGFAPGAGGTQRLTRLLGEHKTLLSMLEGRPFTARQALALGIVDELCQRGQEVETAVRLAARFHGRRRWALASIKQAIYLGGSEPLPRGLLREMRDFGVALAQPEAQALMQDYLARTARRRELPLLEPVSYVRALEQGRFTDEPRRAPQNAEAHPYRRDTVEFSVGGEACRAWLYRPSGVPSAAVVVLGHGIGATRELGLDAYGRKFAEAGLAVLAFTHRNFGDSAGQHRQLISIRSQEEDWHAAIDFVKTLPGVNGSRIAIWGTSFGGGHVMTVASQRSDLICAIAQCPFTDGRASAAVQGLGASLKLLPHVVADYAGQLGLGQGRSIAIAAEQGTPALMSAHDALPGYLRLTPRGTEFINETPARALPSIRRHVPGRAARNIAIPVLFCVSDSDSVAPTAVTLRYARQAPFGTVKTYHAGHFDFYVGAAFEEIVADQLAFLRDTLLVTVPSGRAPD
jgi:uncharacterized protein